MDRERTECSKWAATALLFSCFVVTGCETVPPDELDLVREPAIQAGAIAQPARPVRASRVSKSRIQVRELKTAAAKVQRLPSVVPRPRAVAADILPSEKPSTVLAPAVAFEWPVEGKVIAHFGRDGGLRNDGINIAAEPGTPIHAAASGTVIYADKLKGYGKLILLRHDNRYITAYAHAQGILVSQGDRVSRGDVIGYSGATGDVRAPQLHFEIRQGVKPVDPKLLLFAARDS